MRATTPAFVAILDPIPAYRRGLAVTLSEAGFVIEEPRDLLRWRVGDRRRAIVVTIRSENDLHAIREIRSIDRHFAAVAVLTETSSDAYREALQSGATTAVGEHEPLEEIVVAVKTALDERTILPAAIARDLAVGRRDALFAEGLSEELIDYLRSLANGATVADIASQAGYSEREMYRFLKQLYDAMGVKNRTEALVKASYSGLLDAEQKPTA